MVATELTFACVFYLNGLAVEDFVNVIGGGLKGGWSLDTKEHTN